MNDYVISCCSPADLSEEHFKSRDIHYICFHYFIGDEEHLDDLGKSIPFDEFYSRMAAGEMTRTSQINVSEYVEYFESFLKQGLDIVHVTLSSGISGTYLSATTAADSLRDKYPEQNIYIIDSLAASSGYGLLMDAAADKRDAGMSAEELRDWIEENKLNLNHWFFSSDLTCFIRGGRISKAAGVFGGLLHICPLMNVDYMGRLVPRKKIPGKGRVIKEIVKQMEESANLGRNYNGKCYISMSACYDDARAVADDIESKFKNLDGRVEINNIGNLIGAHTGPGTVALFFWGKERVD